MSSPYPANEKQRALRLSCEHTTAATLKVPSGNYCAGSGVTAQVEEGQRGWHKINERYRKPPLVRRPLYQKPIHYFDENSIYYACQLYDATGNPSDPITCTIQLAGVKYDTNATVVQELVYNPGLLPVAGTFASASFGTSFKGLKSVDVQLADAPLPGTVIVVNFDSHAYTAYYT
ncbi:MAG: hypothetical protein HETSPECPRED_000941 [Heterodermia speciosa]|uniref:Uncharacterized protein n=1 Tax=Heterodermia speciosa TaxID=116794 RepID=A0A8H3EUA0_9LECA|nr:MAG: hypothetical protein HETSPECPRED_000941 [Heterodermia speciosa]